MEILSTDECRAFLRQNRFGHLGLASANSAYVIPVFFGFSGDALYFHSHHGMKDTFIQDTHEACMAVTRVETEDDWESVLVYGRVEPVRLTRDIVEGMESLMRVPLPPELGTSASGEPLRTGRDTQIHRLSISRITGRRSVRPAPESGVEV